MTVYEPKRSIEHFRMSKDTVFDICNKVRPYIQKQDTWYSPSIPVEIQLTVAVYKFAHGANILTCSEFFATGRSTIGRAIREVVDPINIIFKGLISWPEGDQMLTMMGGFQEWCHMPGIHSVNTAPARLHGKQGANALQVRL